ncbi:MAG: Replicative DNA helicase [Calditrichaeota bacterium]|nr:Replicative DNA helicase [Calditrichota bacterium]
MNKPAEQTNGRRKAKEAHEAARVPPSDYQAEQSVLGAVMIDTTAFAKVVDYVKPHSFYWGKHSIIFKVMNDLFNRNEPTDLVTVSTKLRSDEQLDEAGGELYLGELAEATPFPSNVEYYAKIVQEKYLLRRVAELSGDVAEKVYEPAADPEHVIDTALGEFFELQRHHERSGYRALRDINHDTLDELQRIAERGGTVTGVGAGFRALDTLTGGFQKSDLIILAARPSMGKTALALGFALNAARDYKEPVGVISLEMSAKQIAMRLLAMDSRVPLKKIRHASASKLEWRRMADSAARLSELPIYIDDTATQTVTDVRARAKRLKMNYGCGLIVFDYLQLMQPQQRVESQQQFIAQVSRQLKALAKELEVPVIAISQLSRAVEQRGGTKRPILSDLRDSGAIEQDADVVMFVYREAYYRNVQRSDGDGREAEQHEQPQQPKEDVAEIIIGKQRNGPTGVAELTFLKETASFQDKERLVSEHDVPVDTGESDVPF